MNTATNTYFEIEPLRVMLSSRCNDLVRFDDRPQPMAVLRSAIQAELEGLRFGEEQVFRVWIHEPEAIAPGDQTSWDKCISQARRADIFLMLYNGNAGWSGNSEHFADAVGICHAELAAAYSKAPAKVRSIHFPLDGVPDNLPNRRFQKYVVQQKILGTQVETGEAAIDAARRAAVAALLALARAGIGASSGRFFTGEALEWTRMDFHQRRTTTTAVVVDFLVERFDGKAARFADMDTTVVLPLADVRVAFVCDCIPATLTTAAARELVGQPFLRDHQLCAALPDGVAGPVHLVACQKGVTELQALRQLGFPDAIAVTAPFGVYVADEVQKIQMAFIANCRDETSTRHNVQRFLQWLEEQGEDALLARRAVSRRRIADRIAAEQDD